MRKSFQFLTVGKSLSLIVVIFLCIVVSLLVLNGIRSQILSGVRAYVNGEGLYSKGQKDAVIHLVRYAHSRAQSDYDKYLSALAIPLGDRQARLELEKPNPDPTRVYEGFIAAHNHPADIDNMAKLFRRFRSVSYMAQAIDFWTQGDALVARLQQAGDQLHEAVTSTPLDTERIGRIVAEVDALNAQLDGLEDEFSGTLGECNRWLERRLSVVTYSATALLLVSGLLVSWMILRQVKEAERNRSRAEDLARGRARQHETIAHLGETALSGRDLQSLMDEAAHSVTRTLGTDLCAVLELIPETRGLLLRAGVGWKIGAARAQTVGGEPTSEAGYTLAAATPVIINDLRTETRFSASALLRAHAATSGMSVPIAGDRHPYGVLASYATRARSFTSDDVNFMCAVANILGVAIQRKRAEEALQVANRQKDEFLSMLAHELRNPLSPIRSAVHVLRRIGPKEPRIEQAHEMIDRQVAHMTHLVDDLLDVSRVGRGKISLQREVIDLAQLVRFAGEDYRATLEACGLTLTLIVPDQPIWVGGDRTRLAQAVGNLLHNASKFSNPGGHVTVTLATAPDGGAAVLGVRDSGIGMDPEVLKGVFEPFSQADHSLERSRGGLGLGLALVKGLVELHGGKVEAVSAGLGKGSEFVIRLPLAREPPPASTAPAAAGAQRPGRVLVIEDNLDVAESMRVLLEFDGHQVTVAHTGPAGIDAARHFRPEVVLCDIGLPGGMNGFAVAQIMRNDAALNSAYLIALTGYGQEEDRRRARDAGFDMHLIKPVDPAVLDQVLARVFRRADA